MVLRTPSTTLDVFRAVWVVRILPERLVGLGRSRGRLGVRDTVSDKVRTGYQDETRRIVRCKPSAAAQKWGIRESWC